MTGPVEWCTHPRTLHRHGTLAAHTKCGCRCDACKLAAARYDKLTRHRKATGASPRLDPTETRARLEELILGGLTIAQVEQRTGLNRTGLRVILGTYPGRPAAKWVTAKVQAAILACPAGPTDPRETSGLVDPTGSIRRFEALRALGWPRSTLLRRLGVTVQAGTLRPNRRITVSLRDAVTRLYDELWATPPVAGVDIRPQTLALTLNLAAREGWPRPAEWDDDTIDDPAAQPMTGWEDWECPEGHVGRVALYPDRSGRSYPQCTACSAERSHHRRVA